MVSNIEKYNAKAKAALRRVPELEQQLTAEKQLRAAAEAAQLETSRKLTDAYDLLRNTTARADDMDTSNRILKKRIQTLQADLDEARQRGWLSRLIGW